MPDVQPIRRELLVPATPTIAFDVFTARIGAWWPLGEHAVHGDGTAAFVEGRLVEVASNGREAVWGTVTDWQPGHRIAFTWHPGGTADQATQVLVDFEQRGQETLVTLLHSGWEVLVEPMAARNDYEHGWPSVLDRYRSDVSGLSDDPEAWTWAALLHDAGPAAPTIGSLFADPRFREHVAFLQRMHADGYLVAAGAFEGPGGSGMTVLRLPGAGRLAEIVALATVDDLSVASGFFTVAVRPWSVAFTG